jgi:HK97 gp10 family phage protein
MITFQVNITPNIGKLANAFLSVDMAGFVKREVNQMAMAVSKFAKQLTPVDTGFLRSSIQVSPQMFGMQAVVSTNTDYAIFVHEGTKYMRGRPFMMMGAAFAQVAQMKDINKRLDAEFVKEFKKL